MLKRFIAVFMAVALIMVLLTACGTKSTDSTGTVNDNGTVASTDSATTSVDSAASASTATDSAASTVAVTETKMNFTITPPEGWTKKDGTANPTYMKGTCFVNLSQSSLPTDVTDLSKFIDYFKTEFSKSMTGVEYKDAVDLTVDGNPAKKLEYSITSYGVKMVSDVVFIYKGNTVYQLTFAGLSGDFSADEQKIIDSVKIG